MTDEDDKAARKSRIIAFTMAGAWLGLAPTMAAAAMALYSTTSLQGAEEALRRKTDAEIEALLANIGPTAKWTAPMHEHASMRAANLPSPDVYSALVHAVQTVRKDETRPHAWLHLAELERRRANETTPAVIDALRRSIEACPHCDAELGFRRISLITADWWLMPEDLKEAADMELRAWKADPQHAEQARLVQDRALAVGISIGS